MNENDINPVAKLSNMLLELNAYEFNLVAMLIGYIIAQDLDAYAQSSMGNFFESLGQVLETIGSQNQYLERNKGIKTNQEITKELYQLSQKIDNIDQIILKFKNLYQFYLFYCNIKVICIVFFNITTIH